MPDRHAAADAPDATPTDIEGTATEQLGLRWRDRHALYCETAEAATDTDLPFWAVLLLSGTIALFGLALNATAVVIGAMLVAPLLGPMLGLSLALAVGDGRLAVQTAATVSLGAVGVVALAALLTLALPFHEVTAEILSRTRPTLLDLVIAVASGLAGAVVTVSRETRLSASIPGVAIAVALIPPLAVAGFGIGTGWQWDLISGALLLFGANLGGIVLSGMLVFMLVGMHRPDVIETAREWHRRGEATGLARVLERSRAFDRVRVFDAPWARVALVLAFVAAVSGPLTSTLSQVLREVRVQSAADGAARGITAAGGFVLGQSVDVNDHTTDVRLRVASETWIPDDVRSGIEASAEQAAGEPVTLALDQVIVSETEAGVLRDARPSAPAVAPAVASAPAVPTTPEVVAALDARLSGTLKGVAVPDSVALVGATLAVGSGAPRVRVAYRSVRRLPPFSEAMIALQVARGIGVPPAAVSTVAMTRVPLPADSAGVAALAARVAPFPRLRLVVTGDSASTRRGAAALVRAGAAVVARPSRGAARVWVEVPAAPAAHAKPSV